MPSPLSGCNSSGSRGGDSAGDDLSEKSSEGSEQDPSSREQERLLKKLKGEPVDSSDVRLTEGNGRGGSEGCEGRQRRGHSFDLEARSTTTGHKAGPHHQRTESEPTWLGSYRRSSDAAGIANDGRGKVADRADGSDDKSGGVKGEIEPVGGGGVNRKGKENPCDAKLKAVANLHKHMRSMSSMSLADEDCCPICFEEYTNDNPKMSMVCAHHFHLGCIYEWYERSEKCPVCEEQMELDPSTGISLMSLD